MAILNSLDLLAQKTIVQVNEINTKLTVPNGVGDTVKIDASDHREVETAILNLVGNIIESTYNKLDGILLSEIITGDDGDILQWDAGTTSWITVPGGNIAAAGNLYEVQLNDDPAFGSSSNFQYDFDLNDFKLINSTALFRLEATGTKNFVVTKDASSINNLLQIDSTSDVITIGATDSTVKLQRGPSALDESLTLTSDLLNLQNSSLSIKSAATISGNALTVQNSSSTNLIQVTNTGYLLTQRFGFDTSNYIFSSNTAHAFFIGGVFKLNLYATQADFTVPISTSNLILTTGNIISNGATILRGANSSLITNLGFDVRCYGGAGFGGGGGLLSGSFKAGYKQQNLTDVDILTITEKTVNSVSGIGRVNLKLEPYADNAAAIVGGLVAGDLYRTLTGEVRVRV